MSATELERTTLREPAQDGQCFITRSGGHQCVRGPVKVAETIFVHSAFVWSETAVWSHQGNHFDRDTGHVRDGAWIGHDLMFLTDTCVYNGGTH